ncbi:MAG: hypothetical protein IK151_00445 [Erysipelotrichaceae bacterium]|nr:hypothetical protein [Erysipelotrichaceae bacterium]
MCEAMERLKNEGRAMGLFEVIIEGIIQAKEKKAYRLLRYLDDETISCASGLPIERVKEIRENRNKPLS